ncbi:MAG: hypothetical protein DRI88_10420 [Bacteroidetes bacterium]|nr:MAG: hypothetical protein DRI88_10420 [Bacteroidota bacterium]
MEPSNKRQDKLSKEELTALQEAELTIVKRVATALSFIWEFFLTLGKLALAFIFSAMIGLAFVKSIELYNDAKMELDASIIIQQRL